MIDGQTTVHFTPRIWIYARQTDKLCFINVYSSYWNLHKTEGYCCFRQTDRQTTFHFTLILVLKQNRRTNYITCYNLKNKVCLSVLLYFTPDIGIKARQKRNFISPSYWTPRKTDKRTNYASFHVPIGIYEDRHFTPQIGIYAKQTNKLRFIWPPHIGIKVRQTD